jgi:hypothetical protein
MSNRCLWQTELKYPLLLKDARKGTVKNHKIQNIRNLYTGKRG